MRIYTADSEETLRARAFIKDWTAEGVLTPAQHQQLEQNTPSDLRTTNIFLRLVLFFFTLLAIGAATALFFVVFLSRPSDHTTGILCLIFAVACYVAAELAVAQARLYRYGIEEAFLVSSVAFLFVAISSLGRQDYGQLQSYGSLTPAACAALSLWIWHRFGLWYMLVAAMVFTALVADSQTSSPAAQHSIVAFFYLVALIAITAIGRRYRLTWLRARYSLAEALLWLGVYLSLNLQLSSTRLPFLGWAIAPISRTTITGGPFYWITWVLIWCLPPLILTRGIRQKDRFVLAVGALTAVLTLISNKPYLGWTRHSWDPMLLGILLAGTALALRRWLAQGPAGIRHGFTFARPSEKERSWMGTGATVVGFATSPSPSTHPQPHSEAPQSAGGTSGGAGANRDF